MPEAKRSKVWLYFTRKGEGNHLTWWGTVKSCTSFDSLCNPAPSISAGSVGVPGPSLTKKANLSFERVEKLHRVSTKIVEVG